MESRSRILLLGIALVAGASVGAPWQAAAEDTPASETITAVAVDSVAQGVQARGMDGRHKNFAGVAKSADGKGVDLYVTGDDPALTSYLQREYPGSLRIHWVRNNFETLLSSRDRISLDRRFPVSVVAPNVAFNRLDVLTSRELTPAETQLFHGAYGTGEVAAELTGVEAVNPAATRFADTSPFNGGAAIMNSDIGGCTAGFGVTSSDGSKWLTTAGHCYASGTNVITGGIGVVGSGHAPVGQVHGRDWNTSSVATTDSELILTSSSNQIWGLGSSRVQQGAAVNLVTGDQVCASGAYESEVCGVSIVATYANCNPDTGVILSPCIRAQKTGSPAFGKGDSGGPVYTKLSGQLPRPAAVISHLGEFVPCASTSVLPAYPARPCSYTGYLVPVTAVLAHWNVTLN